MDSTVLLNVIKLHTSKASQRKKALVDLIEVAAQDSTTADDKRQLLQIIKEYIDDTYLISKDLSNFQGREYL